jgi:hypothetical protein
MARLIPSTERLKRARLLIQKARDLPVPAGMGKNDLAYIAQVKALLQEARDLVKFIPKTPTATQEMKLEVGKIYQETELADKEILHISFGEKDY